MNDALVSLLNGAGIGDIIIPKKDFIKEHRHIVGLLNRYDIPALKAEAKAQAKELKSETGVDMTGGMGQASGFVRRMMAENALKHKGAYGNPTAPLHPKSTMRQPVAFDLKKLANRSQNGRNATQYGASPFILKHFGNARAAEPYERRFAPMPPTEPYKRKDKPAKEAPKESEAQREARKVWKGDVVEEGTHAERRDARRDARIRVEEEITAEERRIERERQRKEREKQLKEEAERQRIEDERKKAEEEAKKPKPSPFLKERSDWRKIRGLSFPKGVEPQTTRFGGESSIYPSFGNMYSIENQSQFMMSSLRPFSQGWNIGVPATYKGKPIWFFSAGDIYARPENWTPLRREYLGHFDSHGELIPPTPTMEYERGIMGVWLPDPRKNYMAADGKMYRIYEADGTPVNPIDEYERLKQAPVEYPNRPKPDLKKWDKILLGE